MKIDYSMLEQQEPRKPYTLLILNFITNRLRYDEGCMGKADRREALQKNEHSAPRICKQKQNVICGRECNKVCM